MLIMYLMCMIIIPLFIHPRTTTDTTTESTGIKTASKTPRDHGQDKIRPLFVYCNLNNQKPTWKQCIDESCSL